MLLQETKNAMRVRLTLGLLGIATTRSEDVYEVRARALETQGGNGAHRVDIFLRFALALCALLLTASAASATLWVRVSDQNLVRQVVDRGGLVVEVEAGDWSPAYSASMPSTDQRMDVRRVIYGELADSAESLIVRWRGGETADGYILKVDGVEPLARGATAVLFLKPGAEGTWDVFHLFQGVFRTARYEDRVYAFRSLGGVELDLSGQILSPAGDKVAAEAERARELEPFVEWIQGIAEGTAPAADYWCDVPIEALRTTAEEQTFEKYTQLRNPTRWRQFDAGQNVTFRAHVAGQPGLQGGGFSEFRAAIAAWNNDPGSKVRYRYGGTTTSTLGFIRPDGINSIVFDDLDGAADGVFDEPFSCSAGGTIAAGGPWSSASFTHVFQGNTYRNALGADIVTNKNAACILGVPSTARETFAHELGHTLGLGHSCGDSVSGSCAGRPLRNEALMRAQVHADGRGARLSADDRAGISFLYPSEAQQPPSAPTGLSASNAGSLGVVDLRWNDTADNETGFAIERRFGSQSFSQIASVGTNATFYQDDSASTGSSVSYRVRAFNGAGNSGYSNFATVTTSGPTPPSSLIVTSLSPHAVQLDWTDDTAGETEFEIQIRRQPAQNFQFATFAKAAAGATTAVLGELFTDSSFQFRVRAVTPAGNSSWSQPATGVTLPYEAGEPCVSGPATLCLNGGRFQNRVLWRSFDQLAGRGQRISTEASTDSGLFWFFGADNWEMLVKNLDACGFNDRFWVFSGATTNVEYTLQVVDTWTGEAVTYFNPLGSAAPAVTDIDAFQNACGATAPASAPAEQHEQQVSLDLPDGFDKSDGCDEVQTGTDTTLFLNDGRFQVEVEWKDFEGDDGPGHVVQFCSKDSGLFWFFGSDNWEMLVKVLDACSFNDRFWVFSAATTNVEYTLRVKDTQADVTETYFNPLGQASIAITDTVAFATCQ